MPTYKRIDGDYTITTINSSDNVFVDTHTLTVFGNLNVQGNLTYVDVEDLRVEDPFITVGANNTGTIGTALFPEQGLVTQTSSNTFAGIRFNNATLSWQISPGVAANGAPISSYHDIGTANAALPGGSINDIQYKAGANTFGGNSAFTFDLSNTKVTLTGHQVFGNIVTAPASTANAVSLYHNAVGAAGTGLYVQVPPIQDELVSRTRAIAFGIIF